MIYFDEPKLNLTGGEAFFVRLVTYIAFILAIAVTIIFFFSGIPSLKWLALLMALFLIDRLIHLGEGEKTIIEFKGDKINLAEVLTPAALRVIDYSFRRALVTGEDFYLILLKELNSRGDIIESLKRLSISPKDFSQQIEEFLKQTETAKQSRETLLKKIELLAVSAFQNALDTNEKFIEPRNIFAALTTIKEPILTKFFNIFDISPIDIREAIIFGRYRRLFAGVSRLPATLGGFAHKPNFLRPRVMNRAWTARPTHVLDQYSTDLTNLAHNEKIGLLIGHEKEFEQLLNIIARPGKPNALLVGEPGAGKSTMIANLAFRMIKDQVPAVLFDKRLVSLEIGDLIANAQPEILAGRLKAITEDILKAGNIVLFIPNIHDLFRTGTGKTINAIDIFLPIIKSEAIPLIGETYPREFKQYIEPRSDFLDQFEVINVNEISEDEALRFLVYASLMLEKQFKIFITFRALRKAVEVAHRYFRNKLLPGSAEDILKQALAKAHEDGLEILKEETVIEVAERQSKIPIQTAGKEEAQKLLNLEAIIHEKLINQDAAVEAVSRALREYRSGLSRKGGPIAAFLFVGPTGVGKTELSKILAAVQFGSKDLMHRFDMSEYQDKQSIFRFIGAPDGSQGGTLTDAVLHDPYSLVLLDEFEKAHPDILNLFLQVFDDGRLTDSLGRTVDFQNTIIIATSNAHSEFIKTEIEKGREVRDITEELKKKLTDYFKPELLNRFSGIIVFRSLKPEEILIIAGLLVKEVGDTLKEAQGIDLEADELALRKISELGYSPVYGARPLRQVVSEKIRGVLAEKILRGEIKRGDVLKLVYENNDFQFKIKA